MSATAIKTVTLQRLAIGKLVFLEGSRHVKKNSIIDPILTILQFDYCVETMIRAVLDDRGQRVRTKKGGFVVFEELMQELNALEPTLDSSLINQLESLHTQRNMTQHQARQPGTPDTIHYHVIVPIALDHILTKIYGNLITFESISLRSLIDSQLEKTVMADIEKTFASGDYDKTYKMVREIIEHHRQLLREQRGLAHGFGRPPAIVRRDPSTMSIGQRLFGSDDATPHEVRSYLEKITDTVEDLADRIAFAEYYDEINKLVGNEFEKFYGQNYTKEETERAINSAYNIIFGTQGLLSKNDDSEVIIYDFSMSADVRPEAIIGIASDADLTEAFLKITPDLGPGDHKKEDLLETKIPLENIAGLQRADLSQFQPGKYYFVEVHVKSRTGSGFSRHSIAIPTAEKADIKKSDDT